MGQTGRLSRIVGNRIPSGVASAVFAFVLLVTPRTQAEETVRIPTPFDPIAQPAQAIMEYGLLIIYICLAIFVVVMGLIVFTTIRFRVRSDDDGHEPPQVYGSDQLELAWTIVPILIVIIMGLITAGRIMVLERYEPPPNSLAVKIIGHQWWWEIDYPSYGFVTANELHLPVDQLAFLDLKSEDVIHSFWLPQLSGKTDLIPNRTNQMWIEPHETGMAVGQCAEYCGTQHANMLLRVFVHEEEDFKRWVKDQQKTAAIVPSAARGREAFATTACVNCHTIRGLSEIGEFGPDLTHLMSRTTIAAGASVNDRAQLIAWISNPDHIKPGARMPAMKLNDRNILSIASYLSTLK